MISKHVLLLCAIVFASLAPGASADITITGGGSSFDLPVFTRWFEAYRQIDGNVSFNYQPNGSGFGQTALLNQTIDFGASDFTMSDDKLSASKNGPILHLPIVAGAVVVSYNLSDVPKLKLDGDTVAAIFLGKITNWRDPRIAALNPGVNFPDMDIETVHRSDKSGTTFIFTDYLTAVSAAWADGPGRNAAPKWPGGLGGKGNAGVAGMIKNLEGTIGYVELAFAMQTKLRYATIKNKSGKFIEPTPQAVTVAFESANIPDDFRFSMVNGPGDNAYPIAGPSWVLVYQHNSDPAKGRALAGFLKWVVTEGQTITSALDYAPLPESVQKRVVEKIATMN